MIADKLDCCFERGRNRFRYRVGALIVEDGCVLLITSDGCDYYYSVGGGVHIGETSEQAVLREVKEETGVDYEVDRLVFVHENFFKGEFSIEGMICHEVCLYYLLKPRGSRDIDCKSVSPDGKERAEWVPLEKLKDLKVYPREIFTERLCDLPKYPEHVITLVK